MENSKTTTVVTSLNTGLAIDLDKAVAFGNLKVEDTDQTSIKGLIKHYEEALVEIEGTDTTMFVAKCESKKLGTFFRTWIMDQEDNLEWYCLARSAELYSEKNEDTTIFDMLTELY